MYTWAGVQPGGGAGRARRVGAQRDAPRRHRIRQVSYRTRSVHVYVGRCSARRGRGARASCGRSAGRTSSSPDSTSELSYSVCTCIRGQVFSPAGARGARVVWALSGTHLVVTGFDK
ncbi:unnamed protein product [Arctia plantaginis]|nr:unnamed protein product [Arctia plantaginis]CAB3241445.1 unnamed protein product [Arctia plantaginis]